MEQPAFHPLVSIVIPVFNGGRYLSQAIDSALAQTYDRCEVIVVNDGSSDGGETERIALSYGSRIRYLAKENGGVASALNLGIREMRGDCFSWLSHDDLYFTDKVRSQVDFLRAAEDRARLIPYSDFTYVDAEGRYLSTFVGRESPRDPFVYALLERPSINGCTLLIPRCAFAECGGFPEDDRYTQDYETWIRLSARYRFARQDAILVKSRRHRGQASRSDACVAATAAFKRGVLRRLVETDSLRSWYPDDAERKTKARALACSLENQVPGLIDGSLRKALGVSRTDLVGRKLRSVCKAALPRILVRSLEELSRTASECTTRSERIRSLLNELLPQILIRRS